MKYKRSGSMAQVRRICADMPGATLRFSWLSLSVEEANMVLNQDFKPVSFRIQPKKRQVRVSLLPQQRRRVEVILERLWAAKKANQTREAHNFAMRRQDGKIWGPPLNGNSQ